VAIGSAPEIGTEFRTGTDNITYPWVVNGVRHQLMYGDSKVVYICGRPDNLYPQLEWECHKGCCGSTETSADAITEEIPVVTVGLTIYGADGKTYLVQRGNNGKQKQGTGHGV
jgi:hypothetical protein